MLRSQLSGALLRFVSMDGRFRENELTLISALDSDEVDAEDKS